MQTIRSNAGQLYHPKPPLVNSISLLDAFWKSEIIKGKKIAAPSILKNAL
jgi:hypothetical protein